VGLLALSLLVAGCDEDTAVRGHLDGPSDVAVLAPGSFFEVPVAFVANSRSGRVSKLDLKRFHQLVEDSPAPWLPSPDLALGASRGLGEIALVEGDDTLWLWVSDDGTDEILAAPYIEGREDGGQPRWARPALGAVEAAGPDGAALAADAAPTLAQLRLRPGRAAAETWTFTWDGNSLGAEGSIAGPQRNRALPGTPYETDGGEIAFVLALAGQEPEQGTSLRVTVESGVEVFDAGGFVTDLYAIPGTSHLLAAVLPDGDAAFLSLWDTDTRQEFDRIELPVGAVPERISAGRNEGVLWVADSSDIVGGRVLRLDFVPGDADTFSVAELPVPEPTIDVAEGLAPGAHRLFAGAAYSDAVWMLDPDVGTLVDTNPFTPEVDPVRVRSLVSGLAASPGPIETATLDEDGTRFARHGVVAATFAGEGYIIDAETGCVFSQSPAGAYLDASPSALFTDVGWPSSPALAADADTTRVLWTNPCGGVTRTEVWRVRFSELSQDWEVEGSRSGVQNARAQTGVRYTSDDAAIGFLILPGDDPVTDGDVYTFPVTSGVSPLPLQELPGDPVMYTELFDDRDGAWWKVRRREITLVPHLGNDVVLWIDTQGQGDGGLRAIP
jgi:hypothetical protein